MSLSIKQRAIMKFLQHKEEITLSKAVDLIGRNLYTNAAKHVGAVLSNMVKRGLIARRKPGLYGLRQIQCPGCDRLNPEGLGCECGFYEP